MLMNMSVGRTKVIFFISDVIYFAKIVGICICMKLQQAGDRNSWRCGPLYRQPSFQNGSFTTSEESFAIPSPGWDRLLGDFHTARVTASTCNIQASLPVISNLNDFQQTIFNSDLFNTIRHLYKNYDFLRRFHEI